MFAMKMTCRNEILILKIDINDDDKKLTILRGINYSFGKNLEKRFLCMQNIFHIKQYLFLLIKLAG